MSVEAVIDASVALSLIVKGQATPASRAFDFAARTYIAPAVFKLEVRHAMRRLERRGLLPECAADLDLIALEHEIAFQGPVADKDIDDVMFASRSLKLGLYDALYVSLAHSRSAELVSRDGGMIDGARLAGVVVHDLR